MRVAIIGTGLQCDRRAPVILNSRDDVLVSITSDNLQQANDKAKKFNCDVDSDWQSCINRDDIDALIISTPPHLHLEIAKKALARGLHILCEKPLTKNVEEAKELYELSRASSLVVKCGFNHRHHPAIFKAKELLDSGLIGRPLFGRGKYGICGRPEYQKEWRANPEYAAGGHFIEQGSHLIDLFRWFMGEIKQVASMTNNHYFKDQPLDDDGFALFKMQEGATASMHTSLLQWQNEFLFEIFGEDGYLKVEGLGGGYGTEKLYIGKRSFTDPFEDRVIQYRGGDNSWRDEWIHFKNHVNDKNSELLGNAYDGLRAMEIAFAGYESNETGRFISV